MSEVRKAKRKVEGSLDPADVKKAKDELREAQKNVRDHINKTNADEGTRVLVRKSLQEKIYGGDVRIGSDADPVYGPKSPPSEVPEGHAVDVDVAAPKLSAPAQYAEEKIPERLKSVETEKPTEVQQPPVEDVNNSSIDYSEKNGIIRERHKLNDSNDDLQPFGKKSKIGSDLFTEESKARLFERENEIRNNRTEKAIVFNSDGTEHLQKDGDADSVTFSYEERREMKGCILTHNHPDGSPFSPNDIAFLLRNGLSEIRVCFRGGTYILQRTELTTQKKPSLDDVKNAFYEEYERIGEEYNGIAAKNGKSIISYLRQIDENTVKSLANKYKLNFRLEVEQDG